MKLKNLKQKLAIRQMRYDLKELREKDYQDSRQFETEVRFTLERNTREPSFGIDRTGFF